MSNSLKTAGHLYKKQLENWLSKPPISNDTAKKKACDIFFVTGFWWELVDSNHRSIKQQIYSLSPLATRESSLILFRAPHSSALVYYSRAPQKMQAFFQKKFVDNSSTVKYFISLRRHPGSGFRFPPPACQADVRDIIKTRRSQRPGAFPFWCGRWDLNPHVMDTRTSNVPVCRFQHFRIMSSAHGAPTLQKEF